jgi:uncharacterized protein DUF6882
MTLTLEPYVFRIMENQLRLLELLGEHSWSFDMDQGTLTFTSEDGTRTLAECSVQLFGTVSDYENTWLWAWANEASDIPPPLIAGVEKVREQAARENHTLFMEAELPAREGSFPAELAVICAGYLGLFGYYRCPYAGGALYAGIERCPAAERRPRDPLLVVNTLETSISTFDFQHRDAALAYLGQPSQESGDTSLWNLDCQGIRISFDSLGRIVEIRTTLAA